MISVSTGLRLTVSIVLKISSQAKVRKPSCNFHHHFAINTARCRIQMTSLIIYRHQEIRQGFRALRGQTGGICSSRRKSAAICLVWCTILPSAFSVLHAYCEQSIHSHPPAEGSLIAESSTSCRICSSLLSNSMLISAQARSSSLIRSGIATSFL